MTTLLVRDARLVAVAGDLAHDRVVGTNSPVDRYETK